MRLKIPSKLYKVVGDDSTITPPDFTIPTDHIYVSLAEARIVKNLYFRRGAKIITYTRTP